MKVLLLLLCSMLYTPQEMTYPTPEQFDPLDSQWFPKKCMVVVYEKNSGQQYSFILLRYTDRQGVRWIVEIKGTIDTMKCNKLDL